MNSKGGESKVHGHKPKVSNPKVEKEKRERKKSVGVAAYLDELVQENYFKTPRTISAVKEELENRGHHIPMTSLSGPLQRLCQKRSLRRQKTKGDGKRKQTFTYTNW